MFGSTSLRLASLYTTIFAILVVVVGVITLAATRQALSAQFDARIRAESAALVQEYRQRFLLHECRPLPLLVLARQGLPAASQHALHWLHAEPDPACRSMRHTCA